MSSRAAQYLNEIVSLTMMALLIVALAAGETEAVKNPVLASGEPAAAVLALKDSGFRHDGE